MGKERFEEDRRKPMPQKAPPSLYDIPRDRIDPFAHNRKLLPSQLDQGFADWELPGPDSGF